MARKKLRYGWKNPQPLSPKAILNPVTTTVEILWRQDGKVQRKSLPWRTRPATYPALAEWIENYLELVAQGYQPPNHVSPPLPHCARVIRSGRVLAEWRPKRLSPGFSGESPVTPDERPGREGIPAPVPHPHVLDQSASEPSSGHNGTPSPAGYPRSLAVNNASTHDAGRLETG